MLDLSDRNRIAKFPWTQRAGRTDRQARGIDAAAILRQKMDFILVDALADQGVTLTGGQRGDMRRLARETRQHAAARIPRAGRAGELGRERGPLAAHHLADHPAYFYTLRAARHTRTRDLVNMMLAELAPKDIRQLFICHKQMFYQLYASWSDAKKAYVVDYLNERVSGGQGWARARPCSAARPRWKRRPRKMPRAMIWMR